jgi:hypothetical protein
VLAALPTELCLLNSETHYNRIYMCLYGKQVNFCLLSVKAVRGSYTPSLCNPCTMHSELEEHTCKRAEPCHMHRPRQLFPANSGVPVQQQQSRRKCAPASPKMLLTHSVSCFSCRHPTFCPLCQPVRLETQGPPGSKALPPECTAKSDSGIWRYLAI